MSIRVERAIMSDIDVVLDKCQTSISVIDEINDKVETLEKFMNEGFRECLLEERTVTDDSLKETERQIRSDTNNEIAITKYKIITNMNDKIHEDIMPRICENIHNIESLDKKVAILERVVGILSVFVVILIAIMVGVFIV